MKPRFDVSRHGQDAYKAMLALEKYLAASTIEKPLRELVKLRASQVNGCAYCIDMHWKDARAAGETEQRLYGLDAWEESPYYTDRQRAALAWTESVTRVADAHVPDAAYDAARSQFSEQEIIDLTWLVAAINAWIRVAIAARTEPGRYKPSGAH